MFLAKWDTGATGVEKSGLFINAFLDDGESHCGIKVVGTQPNRLQCNTGVGMDPGVGIVRREGPITPDLIDSALAELAERMLIPLPVVGHSMGRHFQSVGHRIQDTSVGMENWIRYLYENPDEAVWVLQKAPLPEGEHDEFNPYTQGAIEFLEQAVKLSPMQFLFLMQHRLDGIFILPSRGGRQGDVKIPELIVPRPTFSDAEMAATIRRLPPTSVVRLSQTVAMAIGQWQYDETADAMVQAVEDHRRSLPADFRTSRREYYGGYGCYNGDCAICGSWLAGQRLVSVEGPTPQKGTPLWHLAWVLGRRGLSPAVQYLGPKTAPAVWDLAFYADVPLIQRPDSIMANPKATDAMLDKARLLDVAYCKNQNLVDQVRKVRAEALSPDTSVVPTTTHNMIPTQLLISILLSPQLTPRERANLVSRKAKEYELRDEKYTNVSSRLVRPKVMPVVPMDIWILDEVLDGILVCEAAQRLSKNGAEFSLEPKDPVRIGKLVNRALREERPELKEALAVWMRWARAGTEETSGP